MPDNVTNELLLEHLKTIQATQASHTRHLHEIKERVGMLEMQYANLSRRVDHIENRLDRV